ncbi:hypothetical protein IMSAGC009_01389 [Lachnospiraceae bacterium]|nr:hypothetical protein IMSAGC009_01389 [Lachnospiraceae bacterium]
MKKISGIIGCAILTFWLIEILKIWNQKKMKEEEYARIQDMAVKNNRLYIMMNRWVEIKQDGKSIAKYLQNKGIRNIAIYGMGTAGETLFREMDDSNIHVKFAIDQNYLNIYTDCRLVPPDRICEEVDAVIVTAVNGFKEIKKMLEESMNCPIWSLEDILYNM